MHITCTHTHTCANTHTYTEVHTLTRMQTLSTSKKDPIHCHLFADWLQVPQEHVDAFAPDKPLTSQVHAFPRLCTCFHVANSIPWSAAADAWAICCGKGSCRTCIDKDERAGEWDAGMPGLLCRCKRVIASVWNSHIWCESGVLFCCSERRQWVSVLIEEIER